MSNEHHFLPSTTSMTMVIGPVLWRAHGSHGLGQETSEAGVGIGRGGGGGGGVGAGGSHAISTAIRFQMSGLWHGVVGRRINHIGSGHWLQMRVVIILIVPHTTTTTTTYYQQ